MESIDDVCLGGIAKDVITGFKGVVMAKSFYLNGCHRVVIQPRELKDGAPVKNCSFDIQQLAVVSNKPVVAAALLRPLQGGFALGVKARDRVSGLEGIVVAQTDWVSGERGVCLQPQAMKDGQMVGAVWLEAATQLEVLDAKPIFTQDTPRALKKPGGPYPEPRSSCQ